MAFGGDGYAIFYGEAGVEVGHGGFVAGGELEFLAVADGVEHDVVAVGAVSLESEGVAGFVEAGFGYFAVAEFAAGEAGHQLHSGTVYGAVAGGGVEAGEAAGFAGFGAFWAFGDAVGPPDGNVGFVRVRYFDPREFVAGGLNPCVEGRANVLTELRSVAGYPSAIADEDFDGQFVCFPCVHAVV